MNKHIRSFFMIGAGNVAWHLSQALCQAGIRCLGVYSQTLAHAQELACTLRAPACNQLSQLEGSADLALISISDDAIPTVASQLLSILGEDCILAHTAGSVSIDVIDQHPHAAVLYPLQSFTKGLLVDLSQVPLFLEASYHLRPALEEMLQRIGIGQVYYCRSQERALLHLSAVFVCNFFNRLLACGELLLPQELKLKDCLMPLIEGTLHKAAELGPHAAQTGPARRGDLSTIHKQLQLLREKGYSELAAIYHLMSLNIMKAYPHTKDKEDE